MEHNPISSGDIAQSMASHNLTEIQHLQRRVEELEARMAEVFDWSEIIADELSKVILRSDSKPNDFSV